MPAEVNLGVRSPKGLLPLCGSKLQLRFQVSCDHVLTHKFSLPFHIITGHKLVVMSYADGSGGPIALRTSPLASELPLTCQALPFAGGPNGPYLSACGGQLLTVRCAHYAGGASLTTFGFVTIVPRYLLPQVMPSHSFAALTALVVRRISGYADRPMPCLCLVARPPRGIGVRTRQRHLAARRRATPKDVERAPGGGALPPGGHVKANTDSLSISFSGSTMDSTFSPAICRSSAEAAARPISRRGTSTVVSRGTH